MKCNYCNSELEEITKVTPDVGEDLEVHPDIIALECKRCGIINFLQRPTV